MTRCPAVLFVSPVQKAELKPPPQHDSAPAETHDTMDMDASDSDCMSSSTHLSKPTSLSARLGTSPAVVPPALNALTQAYPPLNGAPLCTSFRSGILHIAPLSDAPPSQPRPQESRISPIITISERAVNDARSQSTPNCALSAVSHPHRSPLDAPQPALDCVAPPPFLSPPRESSPIRDLATPAASSRGGSQPGSRIASPAPSGADGLVQSCETEPAAELVRLNRDSHDKPRRVLVSLGGMLSITMRGAVAHVERNSPRLGQISILQWSLSDLAQTKSCHPDCRGRPTGCC
ncbi:hypothetical protein DAEQUDRAFT_591549 [Daedalea quercina L-15889]|uniref:Uncharacterized protein n=1 Tax=Daedalea quercina L-15889 TaxID=1314783 RepID=A0A165SWE4_9APHY|nr:hypothetical protein DAEQUDRAFT_591549 [Daedalea quercina L-15889]